MSSTFADGSARWRPGDVLFFAVALLVVAVSDLSCGDPAASYRKDIQSERPTDRIRAIYEAGNRRDPLAVSLLVDRLEDEDEGVRFYAFLALERITGERFGYDYAAPVAERAAAVERWRAFARDRIAAGSASWAQPGGGSSSP